MLVFWFHLIGFIPICDALLEEPLLNLIKNLVYTYLILSIISYISYTNRFLALKIANLHTNQLTPSESCDQDNLLKPGFWGSSYLN